jgi:hypothetical protein
LARVFVAVGPESGEGCGSSRTYALRDLTVLQLAYVLDDLIDELVARDIWTGPRPKLRREPVASRMIGSHSQVAELVAADAAAKQWPGVKP